MSGHIPLPATAIDLPLLPLRDVVVFPHMVIPLFVGRPKSIKALETAMESERRIMLVAQKAAAKDEPAVTDMFEVGCVSTILQMLKLPDGTVKVLVEGQQRARVNRIDDGEAHFTANFTYWSNCCITARRSASISLDFCSSTAASTGVTLAEKCCSPSSILFTRARCCPSTSTFTVPSGSLSIWRMLATQPIS